MCHVISSAGYILHICVFFKRQAGRRISEEEILEASSLMRDWIGDSDNCSVEKRISNPLTGTESPTFIFVIKCSNVYPDFWGF